MVPEVAELVALGRAEGLDAVGVAPAEPFVSTRRDLEQRRDEGLHGGMAFTYRNPERSTTPAATLPAARALVVGARSYWRAARSTAADGVPYGVVARYAWSDHYGALRAGLGAVAARLRDAGWQARVVADDNALVDREAAARAGLGWYGKNANLLLPGQGSWFVLGSVITDAPLVEGAAGPERVPDGCGSCRRCLDACPTGAIVAPGVVDARRCLAWLLQAEGDFPREYRAALGDRIYGCDDCQEVCPPNRLAVRRAPPTEIPDETTQEQVDMLEMLEATDDELLARHGRWYVPRRDTRYLRRNALVVLGNVAAPDDPATEAALRRVLAGPDAMLRRHAVWAARRLGRNDLVEGLADDPDGGVREELGQPVEVRP